MRSLSKVLKRVVFERDNPLLLKESPLTIKKNNEKLLNKVELTRRRFYEDEAKQLLEEALVKTREIIEKSKDEAAQLISKAQAEKQKIEKEAFDKGYKSGVEEATKQQEVVWNEYIRELNKTRQEIKKQNIVFKKHLEKECLKLSLTIAEKILCKAVQDDGNYFLGLIRKSMEKAGEEKDILIRVSEADFERVNPLILELGNGTQKITLIKDPFLYPGDCIIEGPHFEIDAGIRTQIKNIALTLRKL
ncbi:MAG TPA: flagellar assembly protein FliH, partial [Thermoanaerobacterales bacterium]|nr:flagellar assembly protein FliH [Thermoanaerobacterales bacterium]